jgi:hypothetical protein
MENTTVYPFSRPIIYDQKSEQEQQQYAENQSREQNNRMDVPADYIPVIKTDKPIAGISDEKTLTKPNANVVEIPNEVSDKTKEANKTKSFQIKQGYWGTVFATAIGLTVGYVVYVKFLKRK